MGPPTTDSGVLREVVIDRLEINPDGDLSVGYRAGGSPDGLRLPYSCVSPSTLRLFVRWKRERTLLSVSTGDDGTFSFHSVVEHDDYLGDALDAALLVWETVQGIRIGVDGFLAALRRGLFHDPVRAAVNRYLRQ